MPAVLGSRTNHSHGPAVMQMLGYTENIRLCPLPFTPAASCKLRPRASLLVVRLHNAPRQRSAVTLAPLLLLANKKEERRKEKAPLLQCFCIIVIIMVITGVLVCLPGTINCASIAPMHPLHALHTLQHTHPPMHNARHLTATQP
jgi:hypothetical protein